MAVGGASSVRSVLASEWVYAYAESYTGLMPYDLSRLQQLGKRHQRLREQLDELRPELAEEIKAAIAAGARPVDVTKASGYTRDGVRKLLIARDWHSSATLRT